MAEEPLRLGIVGANPKAGWAPRSHLPAIRALPEYELTAVCTTKRESAEASRELFGARKAYWDYRDLVADPEIQVVDVCVRVPYHHEIVQAALEAGKHVYCEWPLGGTMAQTEELAALAAARGLHTMVGVQARGAPSLLHLRNLVAEGWTGRVISASMTQLLPGLLAPRTPDALWRADRRVAVHTLTIASGHSLDALAWCLGPFAEVAAAVTVQALEWPLQEGGTVAVTAPDHVAVTGILAGGAVVSAMVASVPWHGSGFRLEVYGTEGTLVATADTQGQFEACRLQGARKDQGRLADIEVPAGLRSVPIEVPAGAPVNVAQMLRRFGEGIRSGTEPGPTFADAVQSHRLIDAIERSWETRTWVRVEGEGDDGDGEGRPNRAATVRERT